MSSTVRTNTSDMQAASLHHIGYVVSSIKASVDDFAKSVYGTWDGAIIYDPLQQVRVTFIRPSTQVHGVMFELVEPAEAKSPVTGFLSRGGGLHHVCFEVSDLERELASVRLRGGFTARSPLPAAAFSGRRIAWVYTRKRLLVEYLEQ
jgi:methylmalonyl-CoA/ethylmalonyl-CoA epimerase